MKNVVRSLLLALFRIPGVGYLLKLFVAAAKSPQIIEAHDISLNEAADGLRELRAAVDQIMARQQEAESLRVTRHEYDSLTQKMTGFEQHLPGILNHLSSFNALSRNLKREIESIKEGMASGFASAAALEHVGTTVAAVRAHAEALSADVKEVRGLLASFREDEWRHIGSVYQRMETVREELLYEFHHGKDPYRRRNEPAEVRIVDRQKYESCIDGARLNLGCGHLALEGYLNIDMRQLPGVDVVAGVENLPFAANSLAEIFSAHLVEHFPQETLRRRLLPYWHGLLRPGGVLRAVTPDWMTMIGKFAEGEYPFEKLRRVTFGGQDYSGDYHFNMFSQESLRALLAEAGFREVSFPTVGQPNGDCYELEVHAVK